MSNPQSIGEQIRLRRVQELGKGLREMAGLLGISAPYLTDIEKGHRIPPEELLLKIANLYQVSAAELRSAWSRPETIVAEVASQDPTTAQKVPEFLRKARHLTSDQWDQIIDQADKLASPKRRRNP